MAEFVHLHNHSDYSLLKAISTPAGLVKKAQSHGMGAVALSDEGNLFGAIHFYNAAKGTEGSDQVVKPIVGVDFFVAPGSRHEKSAATENANRAQRVVLLAMSDRGYRNLSVLSSIGYTEGFYYRPRIDHQAIADHSEDLIALSGSINGELFELIKQNRMDEAKKLAAWFKELFGPERYYIELTDHGIPEQAPVNSQLLALAKELDIPVVAANDTYYLDRADANFHDSFLCIGNKRKKHEATRFRFSTSEFYFKSAEEMAQLFGHIDGAMENTLKIAEMCNLEIKMPGPLLPDYEVPVEFNSKADQLVGDDLARLRKRFENESDEVKARLDQADTQYFIYESNQGLRKRYGDNPRQELLDRLDYELYVIIWMGFIGYFLIVWDFIRYAKDNGIPVGPGRGSGAGSIVAYSLEITDIDPIHYSLLFERFLNPERVSMPDFDIDFCFERRQEVIDYVTRKYGTEKVGQIITFGTLKAKAVIRDVARVFDLSFQDADVIAKLIPDDLKMTIEKALDQEPKLRELYETSSIHREVIDNARKFEGLHRHASTHAAGVVIGKTELTDYVPLFRDPKTGAISTQFTMDLIEDCGLVKMDFLGLKTLTLITNCQRLIRKHSPDFDIESVPDDDEATFRMLSQGKSGSVFQFESVGMQKTLVDAKPTRIEDLIALNALYRPGPMDNIPQFVEGKKNPASITYPHPTLDKVLEETYGVIVYQEQVMEIVRIIGGFSLGQADQLRRAMGKKKEKLMAQMKVEYMAGAAKKGIPEKTADDIFTLLQPFAGYGFNKSHAAAYSVVAYKTAYLKANFPAEFMAANLTNEIGSPDKFALYLADTRDMGIEVLPPDINKSEKYFNVVEGKILFGLQGIKNLGSAAVDELLRERDANGPYTSFKDVLHRTDGRVVNRKVAEVLIMTGIFDQFDSNRRRLFDGLEGALEEASRAREDRTTGQQDLFGDDEPLTPAALVDDTAPDWDLMTRLGNERELLGDYFSGHPLDSQRELYKLCSSAPLHKFGTLENKSEFQTVALLKEWRVFLTKKGTRMGVGKIEDYYGHVEVVMFSKALGTLSLEPEAGQVLGFKGRVDIRDGREQVSLQEILEPHELVQMDRGEVHLELSERNLSEDQLQVIRDTLYGIQGSCPVYLHLPPHNGHRAAVIKVTEALKIRGNRSSLARMEELPMVVKAWRAL